MKSIQNHTAPKATNPTPTRLRQTVSLNLPSRSHHRPASIRAPINMSNQRKITSPVEGSPVSKSNTEIASETPEQAHTAWVSGP